MCTTFITFQVQAQFNLSGTHYCDFVVWWEGELIIHYSAYRIGANACGTYILQTKNLAVIRNFSFVNGPVLTIS